jgi:hypothetical protein
MELYLHSTKCFHGGHKDNYASIYKLNRKVLMPSSQLYTNMGVDNLENLEVDDRFKDVKCVHVACYSVHTAM